MNKKLISNVICLIASGVCFFFVVNGINSAIYDFAERNDIAESISKYEKYYGSDSESLKKYKEEEGKYLRNGFTAILLSLLSTAGIALAIFQVLGKKIFNAFGWIAASITTATGLAYLISAIIAVSDKEVYVFSMTPTNEKSPMSAPLIIFSVIYFLILAAQFLAVFFSKDNTPAAAPIATPATPVAPVAPVAPQPIAEQPVAPAAPEAPAAPVADQGVNPGTPNLG